MPRREKLPPEWWDTILDGRPYEVNLSQIFGFSSLASFRVATYRQADLRGIDVRTTKLGPRRLLVQASPEIQVLFHEPGEQEPGTQIVSRVQGLSPPRLEVAPAAPVRQLSRGVAPYRPAAAAGPMTRIVESEEDELLGPCSCGQSPRCLPSCSRVVGPGPGPAPGPTVAGSGPGQDPELPDLGPLTQDQLTQDQDPRSFSVDPPPGPDA